MLSTLEGVKILDFGLYFAGPYASRLLCDLGAQVIKLEPILGDTLRPTTKPFMGAQRGKRSIAVDLKHPAGREVAYRIASWADVITHNMRPGVAERLGMGYEQVQKLNPEVVYAYAPGWGSTGPDSQRPGFAPLYSGYVGLHHEASGEGNLPVSQLGNEDNGNGLLGAGGILMALYHRKRTGKGQYLENPQINATLLMAFHIMCRPDGSVVGSLGLDKERRGIHPLDRVYATADGWICVWARTDELFRCLCAVPGLEELAGDPRFAGAAARLAHAKDLQGILEQAFAARSTRAWEEALAAAGVPSEVPAGKGASHRVLTDPEQRRLGRVEEYDHPHWGNVRDLAVFLRLSDATQRRGRPAPELGQHTREILGEFKYSEDEINELFEQSVVG